MRVLTVGTVVKRRATVAGASELTGLTADYLIQRENPAHGVDETAPVSFTHQNAAF